MKRKIALEKPNIGEWLAVIGEYGPKKKNAKLWKDVYRLASKPRRQRVIINLIRLNRIAEEGDSVVIPGKILGVGRVEHKFSVAAIEYSSSAAEKLSKAGCKMEGIKSMLEKDGVKLVI